MSFLSFCTEKKIDYIFFKISTQSRTRMTQHDFSWWWWTLRKKINLHNLEENFQSACICWIKWKSCCLRVCELFYIGCVVDSSRARCMRSHPLLCKIEFFLYRTSCNIKIKIPGRFSRVATLFIEILIQPANSTFQLWNVIHSDRTGFGVN